MIFRLAEQADIERWEQYVRNHELASPYHKWAWGNAVTTAYGFEAHYFLAEDAGEIVGILPSVLLAGIFSKKLCSLPYCDLGGVLANSAEIANQLIEFAQKFANSNNITQLEFRQLKSNDFNLSNEELGGKKVSMRLAMPSTSTELLASFKSKLRSQIHKAQKNGLSFKTGRSPEFLEHFYDVMCVNMRNLGSPVHSKLWFKQIINSFENNCLISVTYFESEPVAAGMILINGNKASIPWASTKPQFNRLAPNMLLYWSLMEYCADNGVQEFDFGRSTFGEGTYKFKSQWGAKPLLLEWQELKHGKLLINKTEAANGLKLKFKNLLIAIWRKLPLSLTITSGSKIRKYIDL